MHAMHRYAFALAVCSSAPLLLGMPKCACLLLPPKIMPVALWLVQLLQVSISDPSAATIVQLE